MKKNLLVLFLVILSLNLSAQTLTLQLSGTVKRDSTLVPVVHHLVIIQSDSNSSGFNFYALRYTGQNGFYDCTIHDVPPGVVFIVKTKDCDSTFLVQTFAGDTTTVVKDFLICNSSAVECHANFNFQPDSLNPLRIHFWDTSIPADMISSRFWTFGDGGTSDHFDPWHEYPEQGYYNVCLTIHTTNGCTSTKCDTIHAGPAPVNCENWITYTASGLSFTFEGHTASPFPTTFSWDMGDGTTLTGQVVEHTFATAGYYNVTLQTVDSIGCGWNRTISVYAHGIELTGHAMLYDNIFVDHGLAELICVESGSSTVVQTKEIGDSAGMYWFANVQPGNYYIKVTLLPSSAFFEQFVPTYHLNAINWGDAELIELGQPSNPYNVFMHHLGDMPSGGGSVSGVITGGGKSSGNPVPGVEVLLQDEEGNVLNFTTTNENGEFTFSSLANGTYRIYPEATLFGTTPSTVILSETNLNASVTFSMSGGHITGINDKIPETDYSVSTFYPNPVKENAYIRINSARPCPVEVKVYSLTGNLDGSYSFSLKKGINTLTIPTAKLSAGIYYVRFTISEDEIFVRSLVK